MKNNRIVVIGNGMVGHHLVESLISQEPKARITVLSSEPRLAYDRVHLSEYFSGKSAEELALTSEATYKQWQVDFHCNAKVTDIKRDDKVVLTESGQQYDYDRLVLATGSYPFVPPIPGNDQAHCLVYRTIDDLDAIQASAENSRVGVVVGGGLLGLEAANALRQLGLQTIEDDA